MAKSPFSILLITYNFLHSSYLDQNLKDIVHQEYGQDGEINSRYILEPFLTYHLTIYFQ